MRTFFSTLALTAIALAAATTAQATATATATIGVVTWTLTDLNPSDGITPSFTLAAGAGNSYSSVQLPTTNSSIYQSVAGNYGATTASGSNFYGSGSSSTSAAGGQTTATINGAAVAGTQLSTFTQAQPESVSFTLSANSLIFLSVPVTLSASTTVGSVGSFYENAYASGYIYASFYDAATGTYSGSTTASRQASAGSQYNNATGLYSGQSISNNGIVQLVFANQTSAPVTGYLSAYAYGNAFSTIAVVPENDTLALMAAGLLAIGATVRRRQRGA